MLNLKWSFLWVIAVCIVLVLSSPLEETNAQRLARGLPPNPPKFLRGVPPTPVISASSRRPSPSSQPPVTLTGKLEVRSHTGGSLGHVRNLKTGGTISGISFGADDDLLVKLTYSPSHPTAFDILATNPKFPAPFYAFTLTADSDLLPAPKSAIWSIDPTTHELKAQWTNADGSKPPTVLAYDAPKNSLFFVSDINAYNAKNGSPASAVNLFFVPI